MIIASFALEIQHHSGHIECIGISHLLTQFGPVFSFRLRRGSKIKLKHYPTFIVLGSETIRTALPIPTIHTIRKYSHTWRILEKRFTNNYDTARIGAGDKNVCEEIGSSLGREVAFVITSSYEHWNVLEVASEEESHVDREPRTAVGARPGTSHNENHHRYEALTRLWRIDCKVRCTHDKN